MHKQKQTRSAHEMAVFCALRHEPLLARAAIWSSFWGQLLPARSNGKKQQTVHRRQGFQGEPCGGVDWVLVQSVWTWRWTKHGKSNHFGTPQTSPPLLTPTPQPDFHAFSYPRLRTKSWSWTRPENILTVFTTGRPKLVRGDPSKVVVIGHFSSVNDFSNSAKITIYGANTVFLEGRTAHFLPKICLWVEFPILCEN